MGPRLFGIFGCVIIITCNCVSGFLIDFHKPPQPCDQLSQYTDLLTKLKSEPCISDTEVWSLIKPLYDQRDDCYKLLINSLTDNCNGVSSSDNYASNKNQGQECHCSDKFPKVDDGTHSETWTCHHSPACKYLADYFFKHHSGSEREFSECKTNHHVWEQLKTIKDIRWPHGIYREITGRLINAYSSGNEYVCQCYIYTTDGPEAFSTKVVTSPSDLLTLSPKSPSSSILSSSLPTNTPAVNTTSVLLTSPLSTESVSSTETATITSTVSTISTTIDTKVSCRKYDVIFDVAVERVITNAFAYPCPSGSRASSEAYVLSTCDVSLPEDWKKGPNVIVHITKMKQQGVKINIDSFSILFQVMDNCETLHAYTPIASFTESTPGYRDNVGLAAVFIKCVDNGITIAYQECDSMTEITNIYKGNTTHIYDASSFHLIL